MLLAHPLCGLLSRLQSIFSQLLYVRSFTCLNAIVFLWIFLSSIEYFLGIRRSDLHIVFKVWGKPQIYTAISLFLINSLYFLIFSNIWVGFWSTTKYWDYIFMELCVTIPRSCLCLLVMNWDASTLQMNLFSHVYHFTLLYTELFCFIEKTQSCKVFLHSLQVTFIFTTLTNFYHSTELPLKLTFREFTCLGCLAADRHSKRAVS